MSDAEAIRKHVSKIIANGMSASNGWHFSEEGYRRLSDQTAMKVMRYLRSKLTTYRDGETHGA